MATKWKNTIRRGLAWAKEYRHLLLAGICVTLGMLLLAALFREACRTSTRTVWFFGLIANVFLGKGLWGLFAFWLNRAYGQWHPDGSGGMEEYAQWKGMQQHLQKELALIFGIVFFIAVLFFLYLLTSNTAYYRFLNLSIGYLFLFTVILQYGLCQVSAFRFLQRLLDQIAAGMMEVSRQRLAEAVQLERESIEKAARSERLKVDLISNVSHDLKTPLTSMVGYIELLKKEDLDPVSRDYVDVISDKAEKLKDMIESLFSLAKASSGNVQFTMETVELNMLLEQILADMEDPIRSSRLEFVKWMTAEDTHMVSDHVHLYRICQNLIENVLKYAAGGTRAFIKTWVEAADTAAEDRIWLEITNTSGYRMDFTKEDIVERFARGDKARSTEGNGLGLAIVSTYTGALGGSFDIQIDCDQFRVQLSFPRGKTDRSET